MPFDGTNYTIKPDVSQITAENFAQWAEKQKRLPDPVKRETGRTCAMARYLRSIGFPRAIMGIDIYLLQGFDQYVGATPAPCWMMEVVRAFDIGRQRSGPTLAKTARDNA